jgi:tryptophan-rich sensory protein
MGGLVAAGSMIATSATAAIAAAKVDRLAAICGAPLVIWSMFAGVLSEELVRKD